MDNPRIVALISNFSFEDMILILIVPVPGPEEKKTFSCSTQMSMKSILLIHVKLPTTVYQQYKLLTLMIKPEISIDVWLFQYL